MLHIARGKQESLWVPWHLQSQQDLAHLLLLEALEDLGHRVHLGFHFHPVTKKDVILCCQVHIMLIHSCNYRNEAV